MGRGEFVLPLTAELGRVLAPESGRFAEVGREEAEPPCMVEL